MTRRDIFVPRRIGAPRGGAPGARFRRSVGCRGCGAEASTAPRGVRSFSRGKDRPEGASRSGRLPGELGGNLPPGSCSKSPGSPRHVAAWAPLGAGRARRGVPVRPGRDGWAGRSSARAEPRATRVNLGRGPRMWGGDPGPLSRLLGRAPPSLAGGSREVGEGWDLDCFSVAIWALPVRHLLRGRGSLCPPARALAGEGARWSAALSLSAGPRALAGCPKQGRGT